MTINDIELYEKMEKISSMFEFEFSYERNNVIYTIYRCKTEHRIRMLITRYPKGPHYKIKFSNYIFKFLSIDDFDGCIKKIEKIVSDYVESEEIDFISVDFGNLFPITSIFTNGEKLVSYNIDLLDELYIPFRYISEQHYRYNKSDNKFDVIKDIIKNISYYSSFKNNRFQVYKLCVDHFISKYIEPFPDKKIILGSFNYLENFRNIIRLSKLNKEIDNVFEFKKLFTFLYTAFVARYFSYKLTKMKREFIFVNEVYSSSKIFNYKAKSLGLKDKVIENESGEKYIMNGNFIACMNFLTINKKYRNILYNKITYDALEKGEEIFDDKIKEFWRDIDGIETKESV